MRTRCLDIGIGRCGNEGVQIHHMTDRTIRDDIQRAMLVGQPLQPEFAMRPKVRKRAPYAATRKSIAPTAIALKRTGIINSPVAEMRKKFYPDG